MKASFQGFQTSFSDVLQTKFDPSICGLFVDGTASESYYCASDTPVRNYVLLRSLGSHLRENETSIIYLTNHLPFSPCLKREHDQGLAYVIDQFQSGLEVNRWLQSMYNKLVWLYVTLSHEKR